MESIRNFPGYIASGAESLDRRAWIAARALTGVAGLGGIVAAGAVCLLVALWPAATAPALGAGLIVRWIGQRLRRRAVLEGDAGRSLAAFRLVNGALECVFDADAVMRYERSLNWRVAAAVASGALCLAAQHFHWELWSLLDLVRIPHWLARAGVFCSPLLPLALGALFLFAHGSEARELDTLQSAIRSRATDAWAQIMRAGEIDGLEAGVAGLYRQLDLWWGGDYRASVQGWLESHTEEAIFDPEAAAAFVKTVTEQARADLNRLAEAAESFRAVESRQYALEALTRVTGEARPGLAEQAARATDALRNLAIARCWEQFTDRAAQIAGELDEAIAEFRLRSQSVVTLPAGVDPYRLLGAETSAATATIKKLRLRLAQVYHPDIGGETSNDAKMAELNAAYDAVMRERAATMK